MAINPVGTLSGLVGNVPIGVFPVRNRDYRDHGRRRIYNIQDSVISLPQPVPFSRVDTFWQPFGKGSCWSFVILASILEAIALGIRVTSFEACRLILRRYCFGPLFCTQERLKFVQRYCPLVFDLFDTFYEFDVIKTIFIIG